jgi:hypothetical protein
MRVSAGFCALATMAAFAEGNLERRGAKLRVTGALQTGSSVSNSIARTAGLRHDCEIGSVFGGHGAIASVCQTPIFREERHQKQSTVMGEVYMVTDSVRANERPAYANVGDFVRLYCAESTVPFWCGAPSRVRPCWQPAV